MLKTHSGSCAQAVGVQWAKSLDEHGLESFHPFNPEQMFSSADIPWIRERNYYPIKSVSFGWGISKISQSIRFNTEQTFISETWLFSFSIIANPTDYCPDGPTWSWLIRQVKKQIIINTSFGIAHFLIWYQLCPFLGLGLLQQPYHLFPLRPRTGNVQTRIPNLPPSCSRNWERFRTIELFTAAIAPSVQSVPKKLE